MFASLHSFIRNLVSSEEELAREAIGNPCSACACLAFSFIGGSTSCAGCSHAANLHFANEEDQQQQQVIAKSETVESPVPEVETVNLDNDPVCEDEEDRKAVEKLQELCSFEFGGALDDHGEDEETSDLEMSQTSTFDFGDWNEEDVNEDQQLEQQLEQQLDQKETPAIIIEKSIPPPTSKKTQPKQTPQAAEIKPEAPKSVTKDNNSFAKVLSTIPFEKQKRGLYFEHEAGFKEAMEQGHIHERQGDYAAAQKQYLQAQHVAIGARGPEWFEVGLAMSAIAAIERKLNNLAQAETLYQNALKIYETTIGCRTTECATLINNLASLRSQQNDYAAADALYKKALNIAESWPGVGDELVIVTWNNIAFLHRKQSNLKAAINAYDHAVAFGDKTLDKMNSDGKRTVARTYNNLGQLHKEMKNERAAADAFSKSIAIWRKHPLLGDPAFAKTLVNAASCARRNGQLAKAWTFLLEAQTMLKKSSSAEEGKLLVSVNKHLKTVSKEMEEKKAEEGGSGRPSRSSAALKKASSKSNRNPFLTKLLEASRSGKLESIMETMPAE